MHGICKQIEQLARKGKVFARWHLAIAITSIFSFCVINSGANVDMGSYAPD